MKILSLFIRHGTQKYQDAPAMLDNYYREILPDAGITRVVIDSALPPGHEEKLSEGGLLIGGDNSHWEFSAWDTAVARMRNQLARYDYVHFVTSAYNQLYTAYIDRMTAPMLAMLQGRDVALGHIDAYNEPVEFLGCRSQAWIRSSFIFIPPATLRRLGPLTQVSGGEEWFSGDPEQPFNSAAPVSLSMRQNIVDWLIGEGTGQGTEWHSRFVLSASTLPYFEAKSLAIFNEHALSLRLLAQGTSLVDPSWLAAVMAKRPGCDASSITDWRAQLDQRRPYL